MKDIITIISFITVVVLTAKLIHKQFVKEENASDWALACMMTSILNILWITVSKYLEV